MIDILFGIIAGIITGMGIGGGSILITLLICFQNINQKIAQATNLIFFIPTSIISTIVNIKNKRINFKLFFFISSIGSIGAAIGAYISTKININILRKLFAIFLITIAIYELAMWYKKFIKKNDK